MDIFSSFLAARAGYWSLIAFDFELVALIVILGRSTGWAFFERWLRRFSWLIPSFLWWGYYYRWPIPKRIVIECIEDFLRIQTRLFFRDSEILAALLIPWLALAIAALLSVPFVWKSVLCLRTVRVASPGEIKVGCKDLSLQKSQAFYRQ